MSGGLHDRDDSELLAAHVAGDAAAFGILFARHRDRLWAVALRTMGNPADAEDGLQDALIAAFRRADSFRGQSAVTTWLHRVVVNACLDRIRAAKARAATPIGEDLSDHLSVGLHHTLSPAPTDPLDTVVANERRAAVLAGLAALPWEQRAALVLVDMEGHSVAEAAEMLDVAVGTVKSRCSRGRRSLAQTLGHLRPAPATDGNPPALPRVSSSLPDPRGPPTN